MLPSIACGCRTKLKDYRTKRRSTETMLGEELLRRFASHILPLHCKRICYLGLFAPQGRNERLEHCRRLTTHWRGVPEKEDDHNRSARVSKIGVKTTDFERQFSLLDSSKFRDRCESVVELITAGSKHRATSYRPFASLLLTDHI